MAEGEHPEYAPPPPTAPPPRPRPQPAQPQYPQPPQHQGSPGYPPPGYGYPQAATNDRPGAAIGAAVLAFVLAGILVLAGFILFEGASLIGTLSDKDPSGKEFVFDGFLNFVAAAALIAGGVSLLGRKQTGRLLLFIGVVVVVLEGIYWFGRFANGALFFWDCLFVVPALIAATLAAGGSTGAWLNGRR